MVKADRVRVRLAQIAGAERRLEDLLARGGDEVTIDVVRARIAELVAGLPDDVRARRADPEGSAT